MILFNSRACPFVALSNFSHSPIVIDGAEWQTVEHYYQAQKFLPHDPAYAEQVRVAATPGKAKRMGRTRLHALRDDWEVIKERVMLDGLRAKFAQHLRSREVLLSTGDEGLVEHAPWGDGYWGDGGDGTGLNRLGVLLVQVREEIV